ncbi:MAG: alpha/beta fold hydrolase [Desulfocurvibacter africanus]
MSGLGLHTNFWDVGGDSLKAMRLIMRMKKEGFIDFGLREAFEYQTVASIVEHISQKKSSEEAESDIVELASRQFPVARLFCLPYACGNPTMYREFGLVLPTDYALLAANMPGHGKNGEPLSSIAAIGRLYAERLAELAGQAPLFILGYSFGGHVAYEIARLLEERNTPANGVIIVSSPPPGVQEGLRAIQDSSDEEITRHSKEIYGYDFKDMTEAERESYLKTLKTDTRSMVEFEFSGALQTPALVLAGSHEEEAAIRDEARKWSRAFAHCEFGELPGAHMLIKTHVGDLAQRTADFIDRLVLEGKGDK